MKVSLITACYNASKTIGSTIASVKSQKGVDLEYILVDGGSTDGTVEIVQNAGATRWLSEPDQGMYDALNKGIALATGDIVGILNADDTFEDEHTLDAIVSAFDDETDALYADVRFVRDGKTTRYYSARHWRPWMPRWGYMVPHPSVYIRRAFFEKFGPYKLGYKISADFELMLRYFCKHKLRLKYLPRSVVKMTPGGLSTCGLKAMYVLNRENARANRENGQFSCLPMMLPKYFYKFLGVLGLKI